MAQTLDFDPQLVDLPFLFDREAVARRFEQHWPARGAAPAITKCRPQDTKYQPARRCVTTYELLAERSGDHPQRTIGVVEVTPAGIAHRLYDDDPRLPWLAAAADSNQMRQRFAGLLGDGVAEACAVVPVRYKPAARCVFRYELSGPDGRQVVFGKLLAEGGEELMATVGALHAASAARGMPRIPQPLAFWPDVHMLLQPEVAGGAELNDLAFDPAQDEAVRERWLYEAGARLAGLHAAGVAGPPRTLADDLDELGEYAAPMALPSPALAQRYELLVGQVAAQAGTPASAPVASHGAFRTDQFMIEGDRLVMIDLDGFCWAEPERDLGNFLAYLSWKAIRRPHDASFIERAGRVFLDGYGRAAAAANQRRLAIYQAASLLKIAGRRFRSLTVKEWPLVPQLLEAAQALLI